MGRSEWEMRRVVSADGTRIGFGRVGEGTVPLVLVHGALSTGRSWMRVARALAGAATCYVMDRRGRGRSDDRAEYALEREIEDVLAVLGAAGDGAFLMGHSSGAIYALEAAARTDVGGLILYEPPLHALRGRFATETWGRIQGAAGEGRFEEAMSIFLREEAQLPEEAIASLKEGERWREMSRTARQSVREWEELVRVAPGPERYREIRCGTLLLAGSETQGHPSFATKALRATLPRAEIRVLAGQGHFAHDGAPELLADAVKAFLTS